MELARPVKKQRAAASAADPDSPVKLSEETELVQDPANDVSTLIAEPPARYPAALAALASVLSMTSLHSALISYRKIKVLPVPKLIQPGPLSEDPDLWGCSALLVDKPQTWTSFDVCGKLKGALRVKKVSCFLLPPLPPLPFESDSRS